MVIRVIVTSFFVTLFDCYLSSEMHLLMGGNVNT